MCIRFGRNVRNIARQTFTAVRKIANLKIWFLFWFFGDFRYGALLFMVIHVIYKYKIGKNSC